MNHKMINIEISKSNGLPNLDTLSYTESCSEVSSYGSMSDKLSYSTSDIDSDDSIFPKCGPNKTDDSNIYSTSSVKCEYINSNTSSDNEEEYRNKCNEIETGSKRKYFDSTDDEPKSKKSKNELKPTYSSFSQKFMEKMGYVPGEGLGKLHQGIVEPVMASKQKGRRGLGTITQKVDHTLVEYDPDEEVCNVFEKIDWLDGDESDFLPLQLNTWLETWIKVDQKKKTLNDEVLFCSTDIVRKIVRYKTAFDNIADEEVRQARSRANPFETIKNGPYLNRAAMKMANIDGVFNFMFTNPVDQSEESLVKDRSLLYFADVCAGPGGFSEYILSKKKWKAKGFGFTLKGENDFKLEDFYEGPCESFEPFYGFHDDGDVYKKENITSFTDHVMKNTDNQGVHFMMADGGFSVKGEECIQEILSKRIYLCQFLVALSIVRSNGHFVCKLFDVFTPFSVGLIYLMSQCFQKISIHKPNTSRPANSERYIICKWKCYNVEEIKEYFFYLNDLFEELKNTDSDIIEIVPLSVLKNDAQFYRYIYDSNNSLGKRQLNSLAKVIKYCDDPKLVDERRDDLKKKCMAYWNVPTKVRKAPANVDVNSFYRNLVENDTSFLNTVPKHVSFEYTLENNLEEYKKLVHDMFTIYDYYAVILGTSKRKVEDVPQNAKFYLGVAHKKIFTYEPGINRQGEWRECKEINLELSPETLVFGQIVQEIVNEDTRQMRPYTFHIIDAYILGGINISEYFYTDRIQECMLYSKSLTRNSMSNLLPIRTKQIFRLEHFKHCFRIQRLLMKNKNYADAVPIDCFSEECDHFFIPTGIFLVKAFRERYNRFYSQSEEKKYILKYPYDDKNRMFSDPSSSNGAASFSESYKSSLVYYFNSCKDKPVLYYVEKFKNFIKNNYYQDKKIADIKYKIK